MHDAPEETTFVSLLDIISDVKTKETLTMKKSKLFHEPFPANMVRWSFIQVSSFLNEFTNYTKSHSVRIGLSFLILQRA